jgi:methionine-rich copper-binding protein CopC
MRFKFMLALLAALGLLAVPAAALAHPRLVAATPAANASVAPPTQITLTFSERLMPRLSGGSLVMTGMPGMKDHPPMKMSGVTSAVGADGKSVVLTLAKPLPRGTYRVEWFVVGGDTHRITGMHVFTVK